MPIPQVRIESVSDRDARALHRFVVFPWQVYRGNPNWVPPLIGDAKKMLRRDVHPFHQHADVAYFVAYRNGEIAGRIAAIDNHRYNEFQGEKTAFFGFFESFDDPTVAGALLEAAAGWARERGLDMMRGPASFSTNEECALLVDGFDSTPCVMMPYNPPYYARLLEGAGFTKAKDLVAYHWAPPQIPERLTRFATEILKRENARIRPLDMKRFEEEIGGFKTIYNQAWERNWGFVPMTDEEILHMAHELRPIVNPKIILFLERAVDGGGVETIGFAMALPDANQALRHANGRLFPFGLLKLLYYSKRIHKVRVPVLGILKEYRGKGLDIPLYHGLFQNGWQDGFREGEFSWILEDNLHIRRALDKLGATVYKTYRFYERPLA